MKLPECVWVLGDRLPVARGKAKKGECGNYDLREHTITVLGDLPPAVALKTVVHEMAHHLFEATGNPERKLSEEDFCALSELLAVTLVRDNPNFAALLAQAYHRTSPQACPSQK